MGNCHGDHYRLYYINISGCEWKISRLNGHNFARDFRIDSECWLWVGAVPCTMCSKKLSEAGWTTSMILENRYYGIILLSFFATFDIFFKYFSGNISWIIAVTVVGVMLPMYLLQIGIQYCSTLVVMMSLCFVPIFTFFFQMFDSRLSWSPITLLGISLLFILGVSSLYLEKRLVSE